MTVPIVVAAFIASLFMKEIPLRQTAHSSLGESDKETTPAFDAPGEFPGL